MYQGPGLLAGFRYPGGAFTPAGAGARYEDRGAPSGSPGARLPLLPVAAEPRPYDLTLLTAEPDWAGQAERVAAAAGRGGVRARAAGRHRPSAAGGMVSRP
jgi:hypothetical protein